MPGLPSENDRVPSRKKAVNAFKWTCPHCGSDLKANRTVASTFCLAVISSLWAGFFVVFKCPEDGVLMVVLLYAVTGLVALPLASIAWFFAGYEEVNKTKDATMPPQ